jgi:hypothetical protein
MSKFPIDVYFIGHISVFFNLDFKFYNNLSSISRFFKWFNNNKIDFLIDKAL